MTQTQRFFWMWAESQLSLCGCGTDGPMEVVKEVLERAWQFWSIEHPASLHLRLDMPMRDAKGRWVELVAKFLDDKGFLEHGTSIGCAWLTDRGKGLLALLSAGYHHQAECGCDAKEYEEYKAFLSSPACIDAAANEWMAWEPRT